MNNIPVTKITKVENIRVGNRYYFPIWTEGRGVVLQIEYISNGMCGFDWGDGSKGAWELENMIRDFNLHKVPQDTKLGLYKRERFNTG